MKAPAGEQVNTSEGFRRWPGVPGVGSNDTKVLPGDGHGAATVIAGREELGEGRWLAGVYRGRG